MVGNGAAELINVLGHVLKGKIAISIPAFNEYIRCFEDCDIVKINSADDGYKLDFSLTTFKNFANYGNAYSVYFDADEASLEDIGIFVTERILTYVDSI